MRAMLRNFFDGFVLGYLLDADGHLRLSRKGKIFHIVAMSQADYENFERVRGHGHVIVASSSVPMSELEAVRKSNSPEIDRSLKLRQISVEKGDITL